MWQIGRQQTCVGVPAAGLGQEPPQALGGNTRLLYLSQHLTSPSTATSSSLSEQASGPVPAGATACAPGAGAPGFFWRGTPRSSLLLGRIFPRPRTAFLLYCHLSALWGILAIYEVPHVSL